MTFEVEVPLARQVEMAMKQMEDELKGLPAGTIVMQVRNDTIGKFGVRHLPVDIAEKRAGGDKVAAGLTASQVSSLRRMAVEAIEKKRSWTHGEITYDFVLRQDKLYLSVTFESNYNMANVFFHVNGKRRNYRDISND